MFTTPDKILALPEMLKRCNSWRVRHDELVFTYGTFDLLHPVHIGYLEEARSLGQRLIVGVYADTLTPQAAVPAEHRAQLLASLMVADGVVIIDEAFPTQLIQSLKPEVVVAPLEDSAAKVDPELLLELQLNYVELVQPDMKAYLELLGKVQA